MSEEKLVLLANRTKKNPALLEAISDAELEEISLELERKYPTKGSHEVTAVIVGTVDELLIKLKYAILAEFQRRDEKQVAELKKDQVASEKEGEFEQMPFFAQGSTLAGLGEVERKALSFRQGIINRGAAYHLLWNDHKELSGDANLSEEQFILADIDFCKREIEKWKDKDHSFKRLWIPILEMSIRTHEARLGEIRKGTKSQPQPDLTTFEKDFEELGRLKDQAKEHLKILAGNNPHGQKIMPDYDFQRLSGYVDAMIENENVLSGIQPVSNFNLPNGHLLHLFYLIHRQLYGMRPTRKYFFGFLRAVFPKQLSSWETNDTIQKKWSVPPGSWEKDLEKMKGDSGD